jgi:hypothetical protein
VPAYASTFEAAPLDRTARVTTRTMWIAAAGSIIAGAAEGRTVRTFVTDRQSVVLLDVGGASLALSPRDRDRFVAEVGRGG